MQDLPHKYSVTASSGATGHVTLESGAVPAIESDAPAEFGGPGDRWSPESLLVAAVADCFILSFRAIARASNLSWTALSCEVEGTLDRVERELLFTAFELRAVLQVPGDTNMDRATRLLEKAEKSCLITNSLKAECRLAVEIEVAS